MGLRRPLLLRRSLRFRLGFIAAAAFFALAVPALANAAPPDGVTAIALDGRVELAWQPAAGASSYQVYRGTTPTTVTTQIATGVITTFTTDAAATNGTTFYYAVRAVIGGVESVNSLLVEATPRARSCSTGNPIVVENCFPGSATWNVANPATVNGIEGFATATSINKGESVNVKVNSPVGFRIEVYRSGYYGDNGGRLISAIRGLPGGAQPACTTQTQTGLIDCANWSTSARITTTASWPTGVYLLRLVRDDNAADTHVLLVVRDDARNSEIFYGVGFTDYQAYNGYAGKSLYDFNSNGTNTVAGTPRAVKVSFDRPYKQASGVEPNWYTKIEHQAVSWLEQSGYDVGYQSDTDLERNGARVRNHRLYILPAHDEYYSAAMRTALEQARDAGVNLFSTGANQVYWKIRFENGAGGQDRIQVCYKSTQSGGADPSGIPTGTWRDPAGANRPENQLLGSMYVGDNDQLSFPLRVSAAEGADRLYRFTGLDAQPAGTSTTIGTDLIGWEWDARVANGFEPAGVRTLGSSPVTGSLLTDAGRFYAPGSTTVHMVRYRAASGALVVSVGTNQWDRGLARTRAGEGAPDARIQQFTTNVLADMGAVPATPVSGVTADDPSGATIAAPAGVTATAEGSDAIRISWSAVAGATGYRVYRANAARNAGVPVGVLASGTPVTTTSFSDFGLNSGVTYHYVVTAVKGSVQSPFSSEVSATTEGFAGGTTVRINAGGGAFTSALGRVYSADTSFTGGAGFTTINPISGTTDPGLYQNERWGQFSYAIPVSNGTYDVRFHFVELYYGTEVPGSCVGKRIFGMDVLDTTGVDIPATMDVCAEAGVRTALVKIVRGVQITDGTVDVRSVYGAADDPELAAIEVVPGNAGSPTVTSTSPAAGATGVSNTSLVTATFSRTMDAATITGSTFTLTGPSGAVPATVSYGPESQTATLTPTSALANDTTYTARLETTIRAADGLALAAPVTWSFTTAPPPPDATPPTATITAPTDGTVTGTVNVSADASDDRGVVGVQFKLDGNDLGAEDAAAPYGVSWDTTVSASGPHTLTAVARDAAGNTTTSGAVSVNVQNTPPTVTITGGPSGTIASAAATISFSSEAGATSQCSLDGAAFSTCSSPQSYTGLADGSHVFEVKATNIAGPGPVASRGWTIDTTPPAVTITTGPSGATNSSTATFSFSSEAGATFQCALDDAPFTSCTSPQAYTAVADGAHTFQVKATDQAGNTSTAVARTWTVDTTPPAVTITAGPSGTTNASGASFSFSSEAGASFQCALDDAAFTSCTSPQAYTALGDGAHTFQVKATDQAGNSGTATTRTWTIDTTPPAVTITAGPSGTTTSAGASFSFTSEAGATFQCALDGAAFASCTSPQAYTALADGAHTFQVKATDQAGNTSTATTRTWTIDTTAPAVTITAGPSGTTTSAGASFSFTSEAGATFQCSLDGAAFSTCSSPQAYTALGDGAHTFQVKATDQAGNSGTATTRTWTIDTTPPAVTITAGQSGTTTSAGASFSFTSEAGATFQCALDSAPFTSCTSPQAYTALADGEHTFQVRAADQAGNTSTATTRTWTIDTTAPAVTITAGPSGATTSSTASFSFTSEAGATLECALDGAPFASCTSPQAYTALGDGEHTFQVKATDQAGNTSTAATRTWTIDTVAPTATITQSPANPSTSASPSFTFTGSELGASFECALDGAGFTPCTSPQSYSALADGPHTFEVKATDQAGNAGATAGHTWTIDSTAPTVTITAGPTGTTTSAAASFSFTSEAGASFQCALDGAPFATCTSPQAYTGLADGSHTFEVRATDQVGNASTPVSRTWTIDATPPAVTITAGPSGATNSNSTSFSFTSDAGASFQCALDGAPFAGCASPQAYTALADGSHTFQVTATDQAGNTSTAAARTWTVDTTAPTSSVTAPAAGATVTATIDVTANAADNVGVAGVQFRLDGANLGAEDTTAPYSVSWDSTTAANGAHTLSAVARDTAGTTTTSVSVAVTVSNGPPDTDGPTVSITAPAAGASVSATTTLTASASDDRGVSGVQFKLDGANLGAEDTAAPYSLSWNTLNSAAGPHTLTAVARDAAGNTTTSAAVDVISVARINTGGAAFTSSTGALWSAEARFTGGSTHATTSTITGTSDQALYRNERWGQFSYAIPVVNGPYEVRFHFVELYYGTTVPGSCLGKRIFGMDIADTVGQDISDLDVCAQVGANAALVRTITGVEVTDGTLNITSVYGSADDPQVAAIEVVPVTGPPPPPDVTSRSPAAGSTGIATGTAVNAVFSRSMDAATITSDAFTLSPPAGSAVAATVTYNAATLTATLTPSAALENSTTYTARLDATIKAADGTALAAPVTWTFTTAAPPPPPDTTPPTATITAPTGGTVSGTVTVTADAADDRGVAGVQFKLDGADLGVEDTTAPYSVSWSTGGVANGDHVLTAVARDAANNPFTSAAVTVDVQNAGPTPGTTTTRINSGDGAVTTAGGLVFQADALFTGGGTWASTSTITGTTDQALYRNERWGQFSYAIPVTTGLYDVHFHFVELYYGTTVPGPCVGKRIFGMNIVDTAGVDIPATLDVCAEVGPNAALVKTIKGVNVADGTLNVQSVYGSVDDPELAAIEVVPAS